MTRHDADEVIGHVQTYQTSAGPILKLARYRRDDPIFTETDWQLIGVGALAVVVALSVFAFFVLLLIPKGPA
jgi:hypothetical protein